MKSMFLALALTLAASHAATADSSDLSAEAIGQEAEAHFTASFDQRCQSISPTRDYTRGTPDIYELRFRPDYEGSEEQVIYLVRFWCGTGAYNEQHVYYHWDTYDGVKLLPFTVPEIDVRYEDEESARLSSLAIIGFDTRDMLINSEYDPESQAIHSFSKWRGLGDASSSGRWLFRDGRFVLVHYQVDATYDDKINPQTILDYDSAP